ncbi:unnamed protein product, partial [Symbiodinium pilosum]
AMENVTQAVNDELTQSLDYKLATSNVNYVQSRRDVQYFPSSLSTFTPTTSRVARIPLTSGMDFIDPESVKIAFRVRNNDATSDLFPGTLEWYNQRGFEGFWQDPGGNAQASPSGEYRLNLVLELEFAEAGDALRPAGGTSDFSIESVRVLASQDSALVESFNKVLLSGRSLVFSYPTMHTQVSNVPSRVTSHNVMAARAYTKPFRQTTDALGECRNLEYPGPGAHPFNLEGQMQLGALQYPRYPIASSAEFHHFLEVMGGTYDSKIKNMRIVDQFYPNTEFIAAFPTERVPKHPLSGISTRSGDLARFTFKNMLADRVQRMYIHLVSYQIVTLSGAASPSWTKETMSLFESTGNILNEGGTTEISGITAGQLATVLTAYTPLTDTAANAAAIGTNTAGVAANAAAVASLQAQVAGLPGPPDLAPYALAADLAAAEGTRCSCRWTPSPPRPPWTPSWRATAMNSAIASANNATLATVGSSYALRTVTDQLALDLAAKQGPTWTKKSPRRSWTGSTTDLTAAVTQAVLDAALGLRDTRLDGHDSDILALQGAGPFATSSDLTGAETSLQSAIDAILAQLAALTTGGGSNLINAQAWSGEIIWDLLLQTNTLRNLHFNAPLSVSLQNDNFTLSLACDSYSVAKADAAVAAAIATALAPFATAAQRDAAIAAALAAYSTTAQMDAAIAAVAAIDLSPYYTGAQTDAAIT